MSESSIDISVSHLVLNKLKSMDDYLYLKNNGLLNENELYLVKESISMLAWESTEIGESSINYIILKGPLYNLKVNKTYKVKFMLNGEKVVEEEGKFTSDGYLDINVDNFTISIQPDIDTLRAYIGTRDDSSYNFDNNPVLQIYEI